MADTSNNPLWTMPPVFDCSEWILLLFGSGTVLALAKHINPRTNSSVTYYDLARTLDDGKDATDAQKAASLLGACGANSGQLQVTVDSTNPAYNTPEYKVSKAKPENIIVKLVRNPNFA